MDDDALLRELTEQERDSVWQSIRLAVDDDDTELGGDHKAGPGPGSLARRRAAPASARDDGASAVASAAAPPVASSSGFKGFGAPPASRLRSTGAAAAIAPGAPKTRSDSAKHTASQTKTNTKAPPSSEASAAPQAPDRSQKQQQQPPPRQPSGNQPDHHHQQQPQQRKGPLRVFLYNAEEARTRALLAELGLAGRVEVVGELKAADAILAAKLARTGKGVNLAQGERTAANAGIPFLVVGRHLTADNLRAALQQLLDPGSEAARAAAARAAANRAPTAAELQALRYDMIRGFGQMLLDGGPQQQEQQREQQQRE